MRIGIYSRPAHPIASALATGFAALGCRSAHRAQRYWKGEVEEFDLVMVNGMRIGAEIAAAYQDAGVPALVYDFGYLKRVNARDEYTQGHWQVGLGGLNRIPAVECSPDRFDALGLEIVEQGGDPNGYVLVCGQVPGDAALGQDASTHRQWLRDQLAVYEDAVYRPHPRGGIAIPGLVGNNQPLDEALAGARLVVTYTSNVGHDALLAGVPVVAHGPAAYAELSGETLPSVQVRRAYFSRVAYAQWTIAEMATGEPQRIWPDLLLNATGDAGADQVRDARDVASDPDAVLVVDANEPLLAATGSRPDNAHPGIQEDGQGLEPVATDYSAMKVPELRALLTERGITIPSNTNKAGLLALLG